MHVPSVPSSFNGGKGVYFEDYKSECGPNAPVVIFCHSLFMDGSMFWNQVIEFKSIYRVIVWDQRGHGKTPTDKPWTFWDSTEDLIHLMNSLGVEKASLVGISMGGYVVMRAAIKYPHRVEGIVVIASSSTSESKAEVWDGLKGAWMAHGPTPEIINNISHLMFGVDFSHFKEGWVLKWKAMRRECVAFAIDAIKNRDCIRAHLPKIQAPALILHAQADAEYGEEHSQEICRLIPQSFGVTISDAPHFLVLTHPEEVNEQLENFLGAITGS